uniref:CARD domain-containing protein n=1 Tax=Sinocyclocheilus grahami TaxID=75366 RepID=A0A672RW65_SINGR
LKMAEIIVKNKLNLIKWLSSDHVILLQHVQVNQLIPTAQYRELMDMTGKDRVVIKLLDIILGKGENVCRDFLDLLKNDDVNELYPELRGWIKTVDTKDNALCTLIERPKLYSFIPYRHVKNRLKVHLVKLWLIFS